jgi:succinoglycan biosynthesis protein ExoO
VHLVFLSRRAKGVPKPADSDQFVDRITALELAGRHLPGIPPHWRKWLTRRRRSSLVHGVISAARWLRQSQDARQVVARIVARDRANVVWVDHTYLTPLITKVPREQVLRVVDTHDVLHLRDASFQQANFPPEAGMTRDEETRMLELFDVVIAIQDEERKVLEEMLPGGKVITAEHAVETNPRPCRRKSLCFVGSGYVTNLESILPFIAGPWQQIRARCPGAALELVGGVCHAEQVVAAAAADERIVLRGVVPKIADIYDGPAAMICPLQIGSGLKIKLVEALAHGKATLASPVAAQGLADGIGAGFICARGPEEFVEQAARLLSDDDYRAGWERGALRYARRFHPDVAYRELRRSILPEEVISIPFDRLPRAQLLKAA